MFIKKDTKLTVISKRKGTYKAIASKDFDTESDEWYSVTLDQACLNGITTNCKWKEGDEVPCRNSECTIEIRA